MSIIMKMMMMTMYRLVGTCVNNDVKVNLNYNSNTNDNNGYMSDENDEIWSTIV